MRARPVLVTGGSGFIGSHVVDRLNAHGYAPRIFDLVPSPWHAEEKVDTVLGSVTDRAALERAMEDCVAVIHLAAVADVADVQREPERSEHVNTRGTLAVLEAARRTGAGRVVFGSTTWVYSDCPEPVVNEDTPVPPPTHLYTATKLAGETYCEAYGRLYDVETTILRFGIPYGPRARPAGVIPAFVSRALAGEPLSVAGDGSQFRNFVYVEDLAEGIVRALDPAAADRVYNLANPARVTILEVARTVGEVLGAGEIAHTEARPGDFGGKQVCSERAARELGWRAETSLAEGVERYIAWRRLPLPAACAAPAAEPEVERSRVLVVSGARGGRDAEQLAASVSAERPGATCSAIDGFAAMGGPAAALRDGRGALLARFPRAYAPADRALVRWRPTRAVATRILHALGARSLMRLIRAHRPDVVVATAPSIAGVLARLRRHGKLRVPVVAPGLNGRTPSGIDATGCWPSPAAAVLGARSTVATPSVWRLRAARVAAAGAFALVLGSLSLSTDDSYQLLSNVLDLKPLTAVSTTQPQVGLLVDARPDQVPGLAFQLSRRGLRASFALNAAPSESTLRTLRLRGDEALPRLRPGDPLRWLGTRHQLGHSARTFGLAHRFLYVTPSHGFTLGQYVLAHTRGATPVAGAVRFSGGGSVSDLRAGEVVEINLPPDPAASQRALDTLVTQLGRQGFAAMPVGALMHS